MSTLTRTTAPSSPAIAASPSDSLIITSPSLSASSLSSSTFDFISVAQTDGSTILSGGGESFSDDEIVWNISESEDLEGPNAGLLSDDDFVVLSRARSPVGVSGSRSTSGSISNIAPTLRAVPTIVGGDNSRGVISVELATELAKLSLGVGLVKSSVGRAGDASGTRTPVGNVKSGVVKKKKKKEIEKVEEDGEKKKRKKEKMKVKVKVKEDGDAKEEKKKKRKKKDKDHSPSLAKSLSTATLVPSHESVPPAPATVQVPLAPLSPASTATPKPPKVKKHRKKEKANVTTPAPAPDSSRDDEEDGITTPISEKASEHTDLTAYDEAVSYITSYISNPEAHHDRVCHLTLLQSFIIELGLLVDLTQLPRTLRSAKAFVKSRAFLNIMDYVAKRGQSPAVVREIMYPSRSALVKDMRRNKKFASLKWVKKSGLQDLLVSAFYR